MDSLKSIQFKTEKTLYIKQVQRRPLMFEDFIGLYWTVFQGLCISQDSPEKQNK